MLQPRYAAYLRTREDEPTMYEYMAFIAFMKCLYFDVQDAQSYHIQDHDDFTKFIEENAHRYNEKGDDL